MTFNKKEVKLNKNSITTKKKNKINDKRNLVSLNDVEKLQKLNLKKNL